MTKFRWLLLILNLFLIAAIIFLVRSRESFFPPETPAASLGAPDFTLTNQKEEPLSLSDLKGRVWVADFIFTRCAGQCPPMSRQMSRFQENVKGLSLVSFSVDPENDSPAALAAYAKEYQADPARWSFLTGSKDELGRVARGFHVTELGEPMLHSVSFILVDTQGFIRGYYDSGDPERVQALEKDATRLIQNAALPV